jgi:predicted lipoprotein with Yx(FWY)xxD motif
MTRILAILTALAAGAAVIAGLALADPADAPMPAAAPAAAPASSAPAAARPAGGTVITVRRSRYGRVLFDGRGRALYLFTRERGSRSRCYGACATAWPPAFTDGAPRAAGGARQRLLGTTRRRDGRTQVTYGGHPLYYYVGDTGPGVINCQDVVEFGGTWLVLGPDGRAIR